MQKYIQSFCKSLGDNGCYFFCLIDIAEKVTGREFDIFKVANHCIDEHFIDFNKDNYNDKNNFFIQNPVGILNYLTGLDWNVRKLRTNDNVSKDAYLVELWKAPDLDGHFARVYRGFNSLQYSYNVANGDIVSYREFTINKGKI